MRSNTNLPTVTLADYLAPMPWNWNKTKALLDLRVAAHRPQCSRPGGQSTG